MKRRLRIANHKRFMTVVSALVFILGMLVSGFAGMLEASAEYPVQWEAVTVQAGDTLWGIADSLCQEDEDVRMKIHEIQQANQMTGAGIRPGDVLMVPVPQTHTDPQLQASR